MDGWMSNVLLELNWNLIYGGSSTTAQLKTVRLVSSTVNKAIRRSAVVSPSNGFEGTGSCSLED